ncbi:MAG: zinc ribbon domain-containing protein [Gammaproteobacteria bacterium]|nr:zinc ribbon domain-containing protein [Gammaproteobacteria bacterium]
MPFYEYECPACKFYTEVLQKLSDKPLKKCPSCGKAGFRRLVSAPVFRLKGSGWYETDFKSDKEGQRNLVAAEREEPAAADAKAKPDDQAPAKPAADAAAAKSDASPAAKGAAPTARKPAAKPTRHSRPPAKSTARRGAKRPASATRRGRGRR